ncbi:glucosylceramidase [Mucilaginibacter sp. OK268]|uniref:glycoside hydrolase family 30 protein n=1 Tax=Mucilaginibacter sp. OK268 TaxID=1881048 RepID=UPI00088ACD79|nr:glycoside hydrolase family 30 beta sandwich domain-containing protein [Mucilaginibacter sp. OK268]SDP44022.1 glucosylceramidase [Mucilaginibacter sp. OK268]
MRIFNIIILIASSLLSSLQVSAQSFNWIKSSDTIFWKLKSVNLQKGAGSAIDITIDEKKSGSKFQSWGTCFNELGWDALNLLPKEKKEIVLNQLFSPDGDMHFTIGRFSMNANDYSRDWYSCDEVDGDFQLKYFNIDRDKKALIPYIREAQRRNPKMTFWISPWSPPSWMKVNHNYAVLSDAKYNQLSPLSEVVLYENTKKRDEHVFPKQVTVNDYLIQDPRYLQAYANYFCKFIDAYKEQDIPIKMVMYQNEAYSYTVYPGCAWTPEGAIRFNTEYLAPALKAKHPNVSLFFGTINTNRYDLVDQVLSDPRMVNTIQGIGFQWEGGQILPAIRKKYPQYQYVQTESECGWGTFDWKSAEHTFDLINSYLGHGCTEYTFWNPVLTDSGTSGWGWKQNALIRVDSQNQTAAYTPEYYAVKHYSRYITPGSRLLSFKEAGNDKKPVLVFQTPEGKYVIVAGNFKDTAQRLRIKIGSKVLDVSLDAHSLNTFEGKKTKAI